MKTVVITGVSSGIGEATTKSLIKAGFRVIGLHRDSIDHLRKEGFENAEFVSIKCDMEDAQQIRSMYDPVREVLGESPLFGLVNNAGISLLGPMIYQDPSEIQSQIDVNFLGPVRLIQTLAPLLGWEGGRTGFTSRIVNVTSVSGRLVFPFMGSYSASKFALEAASDALRRELSDYGLDTIVIEPGAINTPLWPKTTNRPLTEFRETIIGDRFSRFVQMFAARGARHALPAERAAEVILKALLVPKPRARYTIMRRPLRDFSIPKLLPDGILDSMIRRQLR